MKLHPVFDEQKYCDHREQFLVDMEYLINEVLKGLGTTINTKKGREVSKAIMISMYTLTEDPVFWIATLRNGDPKELTSFFQK